MCNSIARANFISDYLKILFFVLQNVSPPTFFKQSHSYLAVMFLGQIRREWLDQIFHLGLKSRRFWVQIPLLPTLKGGR
jgi:hypothetical protein